MIKEPSSENALARKIRAHCWVAGVAVLLGIGVVASANERAALVIGNAAYEHVSPLANPRNDAQDMAGLLRRLDFAVTEGLDLTDAAMEDRIRTFARQAQAAKVALLFYAGHGMQVGGVNYLLPVDAQLKDEADLPFEAVALGLVLRSMGTGTNLVFLDACRDNPFARGWAGAGRSAAVGRGLTRVAEAACRAAPRSASRANTPTAHRRRRPPSICWSSARWPSTSTPTNVVSGGDEQPPLARAGTKRQAVRPAPKVDRRQGAARAGRQGHRPGGVPLVVHALDAHLLVVRPRVHKAKPARLVQIASGVEGVRHKPPVGVSRQHVVHGGEESVAVADEGEHPNRQSVSTSNRQSP